MGWAARSLVFLTIFIALDLRSKRPSNSEPNCCSSGWDFSGLAVLVFLTPWLFNHVPVPLHLFMVLLAILFSTIQATIFTMLSTVYLSLAIEEHEEDH